MYQEGAEKQEVYFYVCVLQSRSEAIKLHGYYELVLIMNFKYYFFPLKSISQSTPLF